MIASKHILPFVLFSATSLLTNLAPSYAARIYNDTNDPICVRGSRPGVSFERLCIEPGTRSKSISWDRVNNVSAFSSNKEYKGPGSLICEVTTYFRYHMVGGNYMVITGRPYLRGDCTICDSNHKRLAGTGKCG